MRWAFGGRREAAPAGPALKAGPPNVSCVPPGLLLSCDGLASGKGGKGRKGSACGPREHSESSSGTGRASGGGAQRAVKKAGREGSVMTAEERLIYSRVSRREF